MTSGGLSPAEFWMWWSGGAGPPPGFGAGIDLAGRAARLRSQVPPGVFEQMSAFDRTRVVRALEQLESLQAQPRFQSGGFTAQQRIRNLQSSVGRILGNAARQAEADLLAKRMAEQEARVAIRQFTARQAAQSARRPFLGLGWGGALTLGLVLMVVLVGGYLGQQQLDELTRIRAIPDDAEPATVFVGPRLSGACLERVALDRGLIWTEVGWRAPNRLPEPALYGSEAQGGFGGDEAAYREGVATWYAELTAEVDAMAAEAAADCGAGVATGTCSEVVSRAVVWKRSENSPDAYDVVSFDGRVHWSVWEWERGRFGEDNERDLFVARLTGDPGTAVCVGYRFIDIDEAQALVASAGGSESTQRHMNQGCYWGLGIEDETGLAYNLADYENMRSGHFDSTGNAALVFGEIACGIGLAADTFVRLEISTEPGADIASSRE